MNRRSVLRRNGDASAARGVKPVRLTGRTRRTARRAPRPVLITGGAGFIGINLAHRLLEEKQPVLLYDNLSRPGVERNLAWLRQTHGNLLDIMVADVRDGPSLRQAVNRASQVFHFAAQVAVTTSLDDPIGDFEINGRGTLNLLEAVRSAPHSPPVIYTSTNKVYGDLADVQLRATPYRYEPVDPLIRQFGFSETRPLEFHSPYGCSKGAACQYVQDYARTFGLRTMVFRMSCIYGPHQFGNEDQGWVAHFLIRALERKPIVVYGDGRQVRDLLYVEDLVKACRLGMQHIDRFPGQVFNIGGGPDQTLSLLELLNQVRTFTSAPPAVVFEDWRLADQKFYTSDIRKFSSATGWRVETEVEAGLRHLYDWLVQARPAIRQRGLLPGNGTDTSPFTRPALRSAEKRAELAELKLKLSRQNGAKLVPIA